MSAQLQQPASLDPHDPSYHPDAWKDYTPAELGGWVHLLIKRAGHRADAAKKTKDLDDAQNYLNLLQAHIDASR